MEQFLIYQLKVTILLAVLFLLYRLLLSKLTFHSFNRAVLLVILLLSFSLPAVRVSLPQTVQDLFPARTVMADEGSPAYDAYELLPAGEAHQTAAQASDSRPKPLDLILLLFLAYCAGVVLCLVRKAVSVSQIVGIIRDGEYRNRTDECDIIESDMVAQPVNWMRCIVMPKEWLEMENKAVWRHECLHARKWHSLDLFLTDIVTAVQWFNPAMRFVRREMELIHEYEADRAAIDGGTPELEYKQMLVGTVAANRGYAMSSWFMESNLKKRIDMIERKESRPAARLRCLVLLLVSALFVVLNSGFAMAAQDGYPEFEDGRAWIYADGTAKVRTFDGVETTVKADDIASYLHGHRRKFKTTRISLRYMDGVSGLAQVQPLAEQLNRYGIKTAVAIDDYMLDHMTMPEYRRAHIIDLGGGQYRFEMNCERQEVFQRGIRIEAPRTMSVTGDVNLMKTWIGMFDGHGVAIYPEDMPWSDALAMAGAAWARGIDQVSVVYEDESPAADLTGLNDNYRMFKGEKGPRTITLIPKDTKFYVQKDEKALDVVKRMNASISSDWFDKGTRIKNPKYQYNQNVQWLHVTNVVRTDKETVVLFYSFQGNDLWLCSQTGLTLKAGGKEYKETGHDGLNGFEDRYFWSPDCGYYYFALRFPAIPDDVQTVDIIDSEDGAVCIRGLQVSENEAGRNDTYTMLLYNSYELKTISVHKDMPDIVKANIAELSPTETMVYMEMQIMEPHSVKGHVGSDFTLTFGNGRELKPLRIEGVKTDVDFDRGGDHVSNFFQIVFPASEPMEWMGGRTVLTGVICHEPIKLEIVSGMKSDGTEDIDSIIRLLQQGINN